MTINDEKLEHPSPVGSQFRIMIAAGGTGGHITPALAIGAALRERLGSNVCVRYVTGSRDIEKRVFDQAEEFPDHLPCDRAPGLNASGIGRGVKVVQSAWMAAKLLREYRPGVILATGGYVCAPILLAARWLGIPYVLHESNSVPGKVTRMFASKAFRVFLGSQTAGERLSSDYNLKYSGTPVRQELLQRTRYEALRRLGLEKDQFGILVLGGSQGARVLNDLVFDLLQHFEAEGLRHRSLNLIWCAGPLNSQSLEQKLSSLGIDRHGIHLTEYLEDMASGYAACDLVISRAGAGTITEIAATRKPSVLIPYPTAADNHQLLNAREMEQLGASIVMEESRISIKKLCSHIQDLMDSEIKREAMKSGCSTRYFEEGLNDIVESLQAACQSGREKEMVA